MSHPATVWCREPVREQLNFVCERPLGLPGDAATTWWQIALVWHNLVSHANSNGRVWVSEQTQADETGLHRRSVQNARFHLVMAGRLVDTGERRAHGVKVLRVLLPDYDAASSLTSTATPTDDQATGRDSRRGASRGTSRDSRRARRPEAVAGVDVQHRTEQNMNGTHDDLIRQAAKKQHDTWQARHRDDQRPSVDDLLRERADVWRPVADKLQVKYPHSEQHHLVTLLLDAAGDAPLHPNLRKVTQDLAANAARHDDNAPNLGATLRRVTTHLAPERKHTA